VNVVEPPIFQVHDPPVTVPLKTTYCGAPAMPPGLEFAGIIPCAPMQDVVGTEYVVPEGVEIPATTIAAAWVVVIVPIVMLVAGGPLVLLNCVWSATALAVPRICTMYIPVPALVLTDPPVMFTEIVADPALATLARVNCARHCPPIQLFRAGVPSAVKVSEPSDEAQLKVAVQVPVVTV